MTTTDPRDIIANQSMSRLQWAVVALTIALNALDGFDVLSISFASPGIAQEWGIDRAALGIVLSMELIGMAIGSVFLGGVADKIGRRPTILGCLVVMAVGMVMATTVRGLVDLSIWRIVTGLGIGGMLAAINAVAAEFSNTRRRDLSVSLMSIGYPVGAVLGGLVAAQLLRGNDWRTVFYFGAGVTALLIPVVYFVIPESVHWLTRKQPAGALERINGALRRMGHATVNALPEVSALARKGSITEIFQPGLVAITTIVTLAYFFHITTFYFIVKWIPKIVVDMGFPASSAAGVLVWTNVGGATGGAVFGLLTLRFGLKPLTIVLLVLSTVTVTLFGRSPADLSASGNDLRDGRLLHQCRHRRSLRDHRARIPNASACVRYRVHSGRGTRRIGAGADHCRLPVHRRIFAADRLDDNGHRIAARGSGADPAQAR